MLVQNRQAEANYEQIKTSLRELGVAKHEIKNHIAALRLYLQSGEYDEAKSYLEKYAAHALPANEMIYHKHFLINAVVSNFAQKAAKLGIRTEINLLADQEGIANPDLHSVLSNILDNAIEAQKNVFPKEKRFIYLTAKRSEPYFIILCENSMAGRLSVADGRIQTSKSGGHHGYGLLAVKQIAKRYDGFVNIKHNETVFTLMAALKDEPAK